MPAKKNKPDDEKTPDQGRRSKLRPEQIEAATKDFELFISTRPKRAIIDPDGAPERIAALKWFMSYDNVEKGQLIRLLYELWQEHQQRVLGEMSK